MFSVFNLNEPFGPKHQKATTERLRSFLNRDAELREMIFGQIPADSQVAETVPFQVPEKYKLAVVRCGVSLFRAIHYRQMKSICRRDQNLLIRFTTNRTIEEEGDPVRAFVSLLKTEEPATADKHVPTRFAWGFRADTDRIALAAEISGSTLWMGFIQRAEPSELLRTRFDWFKGDGELVSECG